MTELAPSVTALSPSASPFEDPLFALLSLEDRELFKRPTTPLKRAGRFLGPTSKNTHYKAAKSGQIPTIDVGGQKFVSTAWLWETWRRGRLAAAA